MQDRSKAATFLRLKQNHYHLPFHLQNKLFAMTERGVNKTSIHLFVILYREIKTNIHIDIPTSQ